jgi:hypothetical protein
MGGSLEFRSNNTQPGRRQLLPSKGSIGDLTDNGDLFCGDMFYHNPGFCFIDDMKDHQASVAKLKSLNVQNDSSRAWETVC